MLRLVALLTLLAAAAHAQPRASDPSSSGGALIPEQAAFDVHFYSLRLDIRPELREIGGFVTVHAEIVLPTSTVVLDLDTTFVVSQIMERGGALPFERHGGRLWIDLGRTRQPGEKLKIGVNYAGPPRVAPNPPWQGGFTWVDRGDGTWWVGVSCQGEGADVWWPVKDHPSDEPDSLRIHVRVPASHTAVSSGQLQYQHDNPDGSRSFEWFVSTPINNYGLSLYVAPYETLTHPYTSTAGDDLPITFYALPEDADKARRLLPQIADQLRFMEETFGPYPFRADKYAVAQAPYLGMEHQTAIAYGDTFTDNDFGFDWLHLHELAHEWWGNLVTVPDWRHFWVHEGTAMYVEALYAERLGGTDAYRRYLLSKRGRILNRQPVVPAANVDTQEAYFGRRGKQITDADVYFKGMWFLHTLRWAVDDDVAFVRALRRMAYPDPAMESVTDGSHTRFATTDDFRRTLEKETGDDLGDLFRLYLDQPHLPRLAAERGDDTLMLRWETPEGYPLTLPVEVSVDGELRRVRMRGGQGEITVPPGSEVVIDPNDRVLKAE
ncbi:MAG: M1 family aminopeptidase [Bacteroidota bacterium]